MSELLFWLVLFFGCTIIGGVIGSTVTSPGLVVLLCMVLGLSWSAIWQFLYKYLTNRISNRDSDG